MQRYDDSRFVGGVMFASVVLQARREYAADIDDVYLIETGNPQWFLWRIPTE